MLLESMAKRRRASCMLNVDAPSVRSRVTKVVQAARITAAGLMPGCWKNQRSSYNRVASIAWAGSCCSGVNRRKRWSGASVSRSNLPLPAYTAEEKPVSPYNDGLGASAQVHSAITTSVALLHSRRLRHRMSGRRDVEAARQSLRLYIQMIHGFGKRRRYDKLAATGQLDLVFERLDLVADGAVKHQPVFADIDIVG